MIRVQLEDGSFRDFPDGTSEADILGTLAPAPVPAPAPEQAPRPGLLQQFGENLLSSLGTAVPNAVSFGTSFLPEYYRKAGDAFAREYQDFYRPTPVPDPSLGERAAQVAGGAIGSLVPTLAALPLGAPGFLASTFLPSAGGERLEALDLGASEGQAKAQGAISGALETLTERFGGNVGKVLGVNRLAKAGARDLVMEPLEEMASTLGSDLSAAYLTKTDPSRAEGIPGRLAEAAFGGLVGAATLGPVQAISRNQTRDQLEEAEKLLVARLRANPADTQALAQLRTVTQGLVQLRNEDELPAKDPLKIARKVGFQDGDVEFVALPAGKAEGGNYIPEVKPTYEELHAIKAYGFQTVGGTSLDEIPFLNAWAELGTGKIKVFNPNLSAARLESELREERMHLILNRTEKGRAALQSFFESNPLTEEELNSPVLKKYTRKPTEIGEEGERQYKLRLTDEFLAKLYKDVSWWRPKVQEFVALAKRAFGLRLTNAQAGRLVLRNLRQQGVTPYEVQGQRQAEVGIPPTLPDLNRVRESAIQTPDGTVFTGPMAREHAPLGVEVRDGVVDRSGVFTPNVRESLASEDDQYLAAVRAGDTATAEALEAQAAARAGYAVGPVFHGTTRKRVTRISPGKAVEVPGAAFFTDNYEMAEEYTLPREYGQTIYETEDGEPIEPGKVVAVRLRLTNPARVDMEGNVGDAIEMGREIRKAKAEGRDGVVFENVYDGMEGSENSGTVYAIFDGSQAKQAGPTTDDAGNPIPLSQRFNAQSQDIRESISERAGQAGVARGEFIGPVFHGTDAPGFEEFKPGQASSVEMFPFGIHFTEDEAFASRYGKRLVRAYLSHGKMLDTDQVVDGASELGQWVAKFVPGSVWFPDGGRRVAYLRNALDAAPPQKLQSKLAEAGYDTLRYVAENYELTPQGKRNSVKAVAYVVLRDPTRVRMVAPDDVRESLGDFKDSKVRNEDGSLKVLYHGTAGEKALDSGITVFTSDPREPGPHFGSRDQAEQFTRDPDLKRRGQIYPVYLNIRNPLRTPDMWPLTSGLPLSMSWRTFDQIQELVKNPKAVMELEKALEGLHSGASLRDALEKLGYDGIVYDNAREGGGDSWIAFRPERQVKSAIGNTGAYDLSRPDIRESIAEKKEAFERDQQALNSIPLGTPLGQTFDRSFHLTKLVRRLLDGLDPAWTERAMAGARKRGDAAAVERYTRRGKLLTGAMAYVWRPLSDLAASLPNLSAKDLRTGSFVDPFAVLKKHFPDGQTRPVEEILIELAEVVAATRETPQDAASATRDVANMAEVIRDFATVDQQTVDTLFTKVWGKTESEKNAAEAAFFKQLSNPEFSDTQQQGTATIIRPIPGPEDIRESISTVDANYLGQKLGLTIELGDTLQATPGKVTVPRETKRGDLENVVTLAQAEANILALPDKFLQDVLLPFAQALDPLAGPDLKRWFNARAQNWQKRSLIRKTLDWWRFKLPTNRVRIEKAFGRLLDTVLSDPNFKVQYDATSPRQAFANQNAEVLSTLRPVVSALRARASKIDVLRRWETDRQNSRELLEKALGDFRARNMYMDQGEIPGLTDDTFLSFIGRAGEKTLERAHAYYQFVSTVERNVRLLEERGKLVRRRATFQVLFAAGVEGVDQQIAALDEKIDWDFVPAAQQHQALLDAQTDAKAARHVLQNNSDVAAWVETVDMATDPDTGADLIPDPSSIPQTTRDNAAIDFFARKQALRDAAEEAQVTIGDRVRSELAELKEELKRKGLRRAEKEVAQAEFIEAATGALNRSGRVEDRPTSDQIRNLSAQAVQFAFGWAELVANEEDTALQQLGLDLSVGEVKNLDKARVGQAFGLSEEVLTEIFDLLERSPDFRNAVVELRDRAEARYRTDPLTIIEGLEATPEEDRPARLASVLRRVRGAIRTTTREITGIETRIDALETELAALEIVSEMVPSSPEILDTLRALRGETDKTRRAELEAKLVQQRNQRDLDEDSRTAVARMVYPSKAGWVFRSPVGGPDLIISPVKQFSKATLKQVRDWLDLADQVKDEVPEAVRRGLVVGSRVASIFLNEHFTQEELHKTLIPTPLLETFARLPLSFKALLPSMVPGLWGGLVQDRLRGVEDAQSARNGVEARWMEPLYQATLRATASLDLDRSKIDDVRAFNLLRNETLHRLRAHGSGVEVGDSLWSVPGKTITAELLALARLDYRISSDARAVDARRPYAGIRVETKRGQLVRPSGETGDVGVARLANLDVLKPFVDAYRNEDPVARKHWWSTPASQNGLRFHFYDADRTDTLIKRTPENRKKAVDLRRRIIADPSLLRNLNTFDDWANASGIPEKELLEELEQYYALATTRVADQSTDPITNTGVFDSETDRTEFTSPAAKLAFPSSWYDYGTTRGLKQFLNRTVNTANVEYLKALTDAEDYLRLLSRRIKDGETPVEEMQWVLGTTKTEFTSEDRNKAAASLDSKAAFFRAQRDASFASRARPAMDWFLRGLHRSGIAPTLATVGAWVQQIVSSGVTSYLALVPSLGPIGAGLLVPFNMGAAVVHAGADFLVQSARNLAPSYVPPAEVDAFLLANGISVSYRKQFEQEREALERGERGTSLIGAAWDEAVRKLSTTLGTLKGDLQNNRFAVRILVPQVILALKYKTALDPASREFLSGLGVGNAEENFQRLKTIPIRRFWTTDLGRAIALKVVRDYNAVSVGNRPDAGPYFTLLGWPSFVVGSLIQSLRRTPDQSRFRFVPAIAAIASAAILSDIMRLEVLDASKRMFREAAQDVLSALPDEDDDEEGWWEFLFHLLGLYRILNAVAAAHSTTPPLQPWDSAYWDRPVMEVVSGLGKNVAGGIGMNSFSLPILSIGSNAIAGVVQMGRGFLDTGAADVKGGARRSLGLAGLYGRILGEFLLPGGRAGMEANAELQSIAQSEGIRIEPVNFGSGTFLPATPFRRELLALGFRLDAGDQTAQAELEKIQARVEDRARDRALRQGKSESEADDAAEQSIRSTVTSLDPYRNAIGRSLTEDEYAKLSARASDKVRKTERARDAVVRGLRLRPSRGMVSPLRKRKGLGKLRRVRL